MSRPPFRACTYVLRYVQYTSLGTFGRYIRSCYAGTYVTYGMDASVGAGGKKRKQRREEFTVRTSIVGTSRCSLETELVHGWAVKAKSIHTMATVTTHTQPTVPGGLYVGRRRGGVTSFDPCSSSRGPARPAWSPAHRPKLAAPAHEPTISPTPQHLSL